LADIEVRVPEILVATSTLAMTTVVARRSVWSLRGVVVVAGRRVTI